MINPVDNPEKYVLDYNLFEYTGFYTMAEAEAYDLGRNHEQKVMVKFVKDWDGKTNSAMGSLLMEAVKKITT